MSKYRTLNTVAYPEDPAKQTELKCVEKKEFYLKTINEKTKNNNSVFR